MSVKRERSVRIYEERDMKKNRIRREKDNVREKRNEQQPITVNVKRGEKYSTP